jgi:hypothetical protein
VVAPFNLVDLSAGFFDYTGSLVAEHHRPHRYAPLAAHHVIVGAAQTDGRNAHQYLSGPRRIERDALNRHWCTDVAKNCSKAIHKLTVHL